MKRFVLLGLAALSLFAGTASAQVTMHRIEVPFILQRAAVPPSEWDSLVVSHSGSRTDTSAAFRLEGWSRLGGIADSSVLFVFDYSCIPGSAVTPASSTTTVTLQQSADGTNWSTVAAALAPFNNAPALTATNTGSYVRRQVHEGSVAADLVVNSRLLRFVVASAAGGQFKLVVSYPRAFVAGGGSPQGLRSGAN